MYINGESVGSGTGADIMGHPFEALAWLANSMAGRGKGLRAGEFVLLGSLVETKWVERGDLVTIDQPGLGSASAGLDTPLPPSECGVSMVEQAPNGLT